MGSCISKETSRRSSTSEAPPRKKSIIEDIVQEGRRMSTAIPPAIYQLAKVADMSPDELAENIRAYRLLLTPKDVISIVLDSSEFEQHLDSYFARKTHNQYRKVSM